MNTRVEKKVWKKTVSLTIAFAMVLSLTACGGGKRGGKDSGKGSGASNKEVVTPDMIYSKEDMDLTEVKGSPGLFDIKDGKAYFIATDKTDKTARVYSMNLDGTEVVELNELKRYDENESFEDIMVDELGDIYIYSLIYDSNTKTRKDFLTVLSSCGTIRTRDNMTDGLEIDPESIFLGLCGNRYYETVAVYDQGVYVFHDTNLALAKVKSNDGAIESAAMTPSGDVVCSFSGGTVARVLNSENHKFEEALEIEPKISGDYNSMINGFGGFDFCYRSDTSIYGYSISAKKATKIIDFPTSDINSDDIGMLMPIDSTTFLCNVNSDGVSTFSKCVKSDGAELDDERTTITYMSLDDVSSGIKNAAAEFNKKNEKYRIEFKSYLSFDDYGREDAESVVEDAKSRMNIDFVAGDTPDIIDLNHLPVRQYIAKGLLEDLTPYLDKDAEVSKEDILPSVEKAMEVDGKLYYLATNFGVSTVVASKNEVGDKKGWTVSELKELLDEKGEGVRPFAMEDKKMILDLLLYSHVDDYIDWTTGECRFNSDDFKTMLEIANKGVNDEQDFEEDISELKKSGKILLSNQVSLYPEYIQAYKNIYESDISFIGYPCDDRHGSYLTLLNQLGICAKSEAKEGAWEFIRTIITKEFQVKDNIMDDGMGRLTYTGIPINKEAFEMCMKAQVAKEPYTDEFGNEISPIDNTGEWDDKVITIGPASEDDIKMYRELVDSITKLGVDNIQVMNIIMEEADGYFHNNKSLDDTADVIQSRVTTYVNESR